MREIVFDLETDGLAATKIWCAVAQVVGQEEQHEFFDGESFNDFLQQNKGATLYGHNAIGFDYPVLRRIWNVDTSPYILRDTLVLSRLSRPSRSGGHSLRAWGNALGFPKGDHNDWSCLSSEMLIYCRQDVRITVSVLASVRKELEGFDERSIILEHEVAEIIHQQELTGWKLNTGKVFELLATLKEKKMELEDKVHETFRPICVPIKEIKPKVKKDGDMSVVGLKFLGSDALDLVGGSFTRIDFPEFNLGSRQQIGTYLQRFGWKPTRFTETGQPEVAEKTLMAIKGIPEASLIADFLTVQKRIAMAQSWIDFEQPDGRVHGRVNSNGAVTGRMTHSEPNMAQVTSGTKIYGKEMRECWIAKEGYSIVGMDASGLELRMLAHYMNDEDYIREVTTGDVHSANQAAAGLPTRDAAKTFIYAFLYGAGDAKIGSIVGGSKAKGAALKRSFLDNTPALKQLRERVGRASKKGYLVGLDGRRIEVRSPHSALNTLLQGAGAVVMKQALVNLNRMVRAHKLDASFVGDIHDEIQAEVIKSHDVKYGKLAVYSVIKAGQDLGLRCPLNAEYKVGNSWAETH